MADVLLVINEEAHARELSRVADLLLKASDLRPVYYVEDRMKPFGVHTRLTASGIETLTSDDISPGQDRPRLELSAARRWAGAYLTFMQALAARLPRHGGRMMTFFRNIGAARDQMLRRCALCDAVLSRGDYVAVLLCEDNVELDTPVWIASAYLRGARSIIVPYTIANTAEFAEACIHSPGHQVSASFANRLVARLFPKWTMRSKGRNFMRAGYAKIAAVELLGLAPPDPWLLNSGDTDSIAVESPAMHDFFSAAGLPAARLVMTGTLADDIMAGVIADAARHRREFLEELALPCERPILVCAFPPDQNTFDRPDCEFADFDDMISFFGETLGAIRGWNVVVVLHPKLRCGGLDALREYGLTLTDRDTASVIPLCDLYLACASATIRWAISCAKPVINYDVYRFGYEDFAGIEGVAPAKTRREFRELLSTITGDFEHLNRMQIAQRRESPRWGFRDGMSGSRLLTLIRGENVPMASQPTGA